MAETRTNGLAEGASAAASPPSGGSVNMRATTVQASNEWWQQLDQRIYQCIKLWGWARSQRALPTRRPHQPKPGIRRYSRNVVPPMLPSGNSIARTRGCWEGGRSAPSRISSIRRRTISN